MTVPLHKIDKSHKEVESQLSCIVMAVRVQCATLTEQLGNSEPYTEHSPKGSYLYTTFH